MLFAEHIHTKVLPTLKPDADSPPLHVVAYTIRAAVQPTPLVAEIQPVLTLLAQVESIRAVFLEQLVEMQGLDKAIVAQSLREHRSSKGNADEIEPIALSDDEDARLSLILKRKNKMRKAYREVVNGLSLLVRFPLTRRTEVDPQSW